MARRKTTGRLTKRQRRLRYALRKAAKAAAVVAVVAALVAADRAGLFGRRPRPDKVRYDGRTFPVARVVDGDTLDVETPDGDRPQTRVRLWGVDTPEMVKPDAPVRHFGPEASRFAKDLCAGKRVTLRLEPHRTRGKYGRLLAYVVLPDGRMLNRMLVEGGFGYADPRFEHSYKAEFADLQAKARAAGRGLWKDVTEAELPYYYRGKGILPGP